MEAVKTIERDGFRAIIEEDSETESPRVWDNLGKMVCWHRGYNLGDEQPKQDFQTWLRELARELVNANDADLIPDEHVERIIAKHTEMIALGLYDHSGVTMYAGGGSHVFDGGGWDSGTVGVIYVTREKIISEYGSDSPDNRERARACLLSEIETYDQYLRGDTYYIAIKDADDNIADSCGGFFGFEYAEEEAERMLTHCIEAERTNSAECASLMHV